MDAREYKNIKARIAYEEYKNKLPKCDECPDCKAFSGRRNKQRGCMACNKLIDNRVTTSPEWCPKREGEFLK